MSLDTEERPGFKYSSDDDSDTKPSGRGPSEGRFNFNKSWSGTGVNNDYNPNNPASKAKIANAEANPDNKSGQLGSDSLNGAESKLSSKAAKLNDTVGKGYRAVGGKSGLSQISSMITKKRAAGGAAGGGIIAIIVTILIATGSLTVINLSETLDGAGNINETVVSNTATGRRINSFTKIMQVSFKKGAQNKLTKLTEKKFAAEGFIVVTEKGAIKSLKKDGIELIFDGSDKNLTRRIASLTSSSDPLERAFVKSFDNVAREDVSRYAGIVTRRNFFQRNGINRFIDWIAASRVTAEEGLEGNPRSQLFKAATMQDDIQKNLDAPPGNTVRFVDEETNGRTETKISNEIQDAADKAKADIEANNFARPVSSEDAAAESVARNQEAIVDTLEKTSGAADNVASELGGGIGAKLGGKFLTALGSVDPTTPVRIACDAKGQIQFVKYLRASLMTLELAKGYYRFKTVADHQQAGVIAESSLKLMSLYVAGATGSSGVQNVLSKGRIPVSANAIEKYGVGYADVGILAAVATFLESVPGLNSETCKFVQNPFTQVGTTIVGGFLSAASGGTLTGVNLGASIGITLGYEIVKTVATPLLISIAGGFVIDYFENEIDAGDGLRAGSEALRSITANGNALLPATNEIYQAQATRSEALYQENIAQKSFFDRYFSVNQVDSLVTKISFMLPRTTDQTTSKMQSFALNPFSELDSVAQTITGTRTSRVFASNQCTDEAVIKYNIATDPFCNVIHSYSPILDLDQTEEVLRGGGYIDGSGEPIGEFEEFVKKCFDARPDVLRPLEIKKDGSSPDEDSTCVVGINDELLAGDVKEFFPGINSPDNRNWVAKIASPRVSAQTPDIERTPTKKERFGAWYGYLVDRENMTAQITDDYGDNKDNETANGNIFFLGDSITVGMQNLAGTDTQNTYLERTFEEAGWAAAEVNAQGCRAVYQTIGPLPGGSGCPAGPIIDGIDAVEQATFLNSNNTGTVVVGLGTNAYETGPDGSVSNDLFKLKAAQVINNIRTKSPDANIYWVNLTARNGPTQRQLERNQILNDLEQEENIKVLDWAAHVESTKQSPNTDDDAPFATLAENEVHHDAVGYRAKVKFLLDNIPVPSSSIGAVDLDCSGYDKIINPSSTERVTYSEEIKQQCEKLKNDCQNGPAGTEAIICSAIKYDGVYYGNGYGSYAGAKAIPIYGFSSTSNNFGLQPSSWLANRSEGLSPNNLLECSGLTSLALFETYGIEGVGCSGNWTQRNRPDLFDQLENPGEIRPGDFLTKTFSCNSDTSGHVAIAASVPSLNGDIIVYETDSWKKPVRFEKKNLYRDFPAGRSRYIGEGAAAL